VPRAARLQDTAALAVRAGGRSRIYPPEHQDLGLEVQAAGALIIEASMAMEPVATLFPNPLLGTPMYRLATGR
jgi:hypothetical protein